MSTEPRHIILVEPSATQRYVLLKMLQTLGYRTTVAESFEEGIRLINAGETAARPAPAVVLGWPAQTQPVADELLKVHRCYLQAIWPLLEEERVHALAHITGGGLSDNLPRVLPDGLRAVVKVGSFKAY